MNILGPQIAKHEIMKLILCFLEPAQLLHLNLLSDKCYNKFVPLAIKSIKDLSQKKRAFVEELLSSVENKAPFCEVKAHIPLMKPFTI